MNSTVETNVITQKHIEKALSYTQYRALVDELLKEDKTTGENQTEELTQYTKMNVQRMKRWDKTAKIQEALQKTLEGVNEKWIWVILTEGWCGDAAQNIPAIVKIAEQSPNIEVKLLLRDENPEVIEGYLTNGGKAIPKLVALKAANLKELGTWGPRPAAVQKMVLEHKKNPSESYEKFTENLHKWYAEDKAQSIQVEFIELIQNWISK